MPGKESESHVSQRHTKVGRSPVREGEVKLWVTETIKIKGQSRAQRLSRLAMCKEAKAFQHFIHPSTNRPTNQLLEPKRREQRNKVVPLPLLFLSFPLPLPLSSLPSPFPKLLPSHLQSFPVITSYLITKQEKTLLDTSSPLPLSPQQGPAPPRKQNSIPAKTPLLLLLSKPLPCPPAHSEQVMHPEEREKKTATTVSTTRGLGPGWARDADPDLDSAVPSPTLFLPEFPGPKEKFTRSPLVFIIA